MSKKSRKNSSKSVTTKVTKGASKASPAKAAKAKRKSPARTVAAKPAKSAKAISKTTTKPTVKAAAKTTKPAAAKKVATAQKAPARKTASKAGAKAPKPATEKAVAKRAAAPTPAKENAAPAPTIAIEGAKAPAFQLPRDGGDSVALSDYAGRKLVIFFYPRASTPGCTKEAIDFTRLRGDFETAGTAVLGVSADPLKAQENFRDKYSLGVPLLSDATQAMLKAYGAWGEKSMYGKVFEGVLRTTVLIAADGKVAKIWRGVKVDGHADAVLEEARRI